MKGIPERAGTTTGCHNSRPLTVGLVSSSRSSLHDVHKSSSSECLPYRVSYISLYCSIEGGRLTCILTYLRRVCFARWRNHRKRPSGRSRSPGSPARERPLGATAPGSPDRPPSAPRRSHEIDQPEARACPRPGSESARADRREAPSPRRWSP